MDLLLQYPGLFYVFSLLLGLAVGSFLNVVVFRLPPLLEYRWGQECAELTGQPNSGEEPPPGLVRPRSRCPHCGHPIRPWENIPVLSYLLLRGRCSACSAPIGLRYPVTEMVCGLLSVLVVWRLGVGVEAAAALVLTWTLLTLALIDYDTKLLPDVITLPLLWLGLLMSLGGWHSDPVSSIAGAAAGYLSLWSVYHLFRLLTGKEGMGYGDFKLLALLGAWLGWQHLPQIILLSALVGAVVGTALALIRRRDRQLPIPFGPYLAAAGWISLMWGERINQAYLQWSGLA